MHRVRGAKGTLARGPFRTGTFKTPCGRGIMQALTSILLFFLRLTSATLPCFLGTQRPFQAWPSICILFCSIMSYRHHHQLSSAANYTSMFVFELPTAVLVLTFLAASRNKWIRRILSSRSGCPEKQQTIGLFNRKLGFRNCLLLEICNCQFRCCSFRNAKANTWRGRKRGNNESDSRRF